MQDTILYILSPYINAVLNRRRFCCVIRIDDAIVKSP